MKHSDTVWWCESHQRVATHIAGDGRRHCDPALGGITLPCNVKGYKRGITLVDDRTEAQQDADFVASCGGKEAADKIISEAAEKIRKAVDDEVIRKLVQADCEHTTVLDCNPPVCGLCGKMLDE